MQTQRSVAMAVIEKKFATIDSGSLSSSFSISLDLKREASSARFWKSRWYCVFA